MAGLNKVLAEHRGEILLFETWKPKDSWKGRQRFLGEYRVLKCDWTPGSGSRKGDRLLVFSLVPVETMPNDAQLSIAARVEDDIAVLRAEAVAAGQPVAPVRATRSEYGCRSVCVARYVLARANGVCKACKESAPFKRVEGTWYLEAHRTRQLADKGPDDIMHVAAICPNCHREAHLGPDIDGFREKVEKLIAEKEGANR
jgi:5-methylcytosine-specific restriction protein A